MHGSIRSAILRALEERPGEWLTRDELRIGAEKVLQTYITTHYLNTAILDAKSHHQLLVRMVDGEKLYTHIPRERREWVRKIMNRGYNIVIARFLKPEWGDDGEQVRQHRQPDLGQTQKLTTHAKEFGLAVFTQENSEKGWEWVITDGQKEVRTFPHPDQVWAFLKGVQWAKDEEWMRGDDVIGGPS